MYSNTLLVIKALFVAGFSPKLLVTNETTLVTIDTRNGDEQTLSLGGLIRAVDFDYLSNTVFWVDSANCNINS